MTKTIGRNEVSATLLKVEAKLKELKSKDAPVFATKDKYLDGIGYIHEIQDRMGLARALAEVNGYEDVLKESAKELGFEPTKDELLLQGFPTETWKKDIFNAKAELDKVQMIKDLILAKKKLGNNLSEDDMFMRDMEKVSKLVSVLVD